jgi:hypothetical protein
METGVARLMEGVHANPDAGKPAPNAAKAVTIVRAGIRFWF